MTATASGSFALNDKRLRGRNIINRNASDYPASPETGEEVQDSTEIGINQPVRRGPVRRARSFRGLRIVLAVFVACFLVAGLGLGVVAFLFQGKAVEGSTITTEVKNQLQSMVGDDYDVSLGSTFLDFSSIGQVKLKSRDVLITRKATGDELSRIELVEVRGSLWGFWRGSIGLDRIRIQDAVLDWNQMYSGSAFLPAHLSDPLDLAGRGFVDLQKNFEANAFKFFEISNSKILGPVMGRDDASPLLIDLVRLEPEGTSGFSVVGNIRSEHSSVVLNSTYRKDEGTGKAAVYEFSASGIGAREWAHKIDSTEGLIGSDATFDVSGILSFDREGNALDPVMKIVTSASNLRIGEDSVSPVETANINLRIFLEKNQIELDPSELAIGRLRAVLIGGIKPENSELGYHGPIRYDLIMRNGQFAPTVEGEEAVPAAFKLAGLFNPQTGWLDMQRIVMTTQKGFIEGSGKIGFQDPSPSIQASAKTDGISVAALKQFWPYFISEGARDWVHSHVLDGWVKSGSFHADIPPGVIFEIDNGAKLAPEEYAIDLNIEEFNFRPLGELPPIKNAKGNFKIEGMRLEANLNTGEIVEEGVGKLVARRGSFAIPDFGAPVREGEVKVDLEGDIRTLAAVSERKPLELMRRMKVSADQFSGQGHADIIARFPVGRKGSYEDVDWNILLDMKNGASKKKLAGRALSRANLLIDANPLGAKVTGTMNIDGINARVDFVEPIGKSGRVKRYRTVVATLDAKARSRLGVNLDPVVVGPVAVKVKQEKGRENYSLDFSDAELNLPWVGWRKGKGIGSKASFTLKRLKSGVKLENFKLSGPGFKGSGTLGMDKQGLKSANISGLRLNDGDDIQFKLERTKEAYNINASGLSYDARGILNALIHEGGFSKAQGGRSVNLVANFEKVSGFGNRVIYNAVLLYEARQGRLSRLDMRGAGSDGRRYNIQAQLNGNDTLFTIKTNDAGTALAFSNIYTRMEGGRLEANLIQSANGPYVGPVRITDFAVVNEPRLKRMASSVRRQMPTERGSRGAIIPDDGEKKVRFLLADSKIERGKGYFKIRDAIVRSTNMGIAMDGVVYNEKDRMKLSGTFMPANGVNLAVSAIPLLGKLFSNGRDNALIGITYRLHGPRTNPELEINPLSIVTPGIFNKVFEFKQ